MFQNHDKDVTFNPGFSVGTVAVRGATPFKQGYHHYFEIEMSSDVYGTDMVNICFYIFVESCYLFIPLQ